MDTNLAHGHEPLATRSPDERRQAGAALRREVPRSAHGEWIQPADRADPVEILIEQGKSRIQELLPIRYGRMRADPFAFLRGAAAVMAADLARTPATGIRMQACGDAHLANFGSYATPEGLPVFDINDFDETLPAPFEWDLKRLAASLVVSGRVAQYAEKACRKLALTAAQTYGEHMAELAVLPPVVTWNHRIDLTKAIADIDQPKVRDAVEKRLARVLESGAKHFGLTAKQGGVIHIPEKPPLVYHLSNMICRPARPSRPMPRLCRRIAGCCCIATLCETSRSRRSGWAASAHSAQSGS